MFLLLAIAASGPVLSNLELWSTVTGFAVPFVTAAISSSRWSSTMRWLAFVVVALVVAFVTTWLTGNLSHHDLLRSGLIVAIAGQAAYHSFKPAVHEVQDATSNLATTKPTPPAA